MSPVQTLLARPLVAQPLRRITKNIVRAMHADSALRKLAARGMVSSMVDLPPPVGEFHGRVKRKHLQLYALELILITVANFVRTVFS